MVSDSLVSIFYKRMDNSHCMVRNIQYNMKNSPCKIHKSKSIVFENVNYSSCSSVTGRSARNAAKYMAVHALIQIYNYYYITIFNHIWGRM